MSTAHLVLGLWLGLAGPPPSGSSKTGAPPPLLQQVGELARSAQSRYETADFAGAIELWTQAYDLLSDKPGFTSQRNVLAYQIGQACVEAYAIDPKIAYLRKADKLFTGYLQSIDPQDTETKTDIETKLADIRAKIAASEQLDAEQLERERQEAERRQAAAEAAAAAAATPDPAIERARQAEIAARRKAAERDAKRWKRISIAGGATLATGTAMLAVMAVGLARGNKLDADGDAAVAAGNPDPMQLQDLRAQGVTANRLAIAGGIVGGVLVVTGAALVAAGVVNEKKARRNLALAPTWLPGGAGVVFAARF